MGRKRKAAKLQQKGPMPESENNSVGGLELDAKGNNPSSEMVDLRPDSTNPTLEKVESQHTKSASKRMKKKTVTSVRRSGRIQGAVMATRNQDIASIIEEITLSESDNEDKSEDGAASEHTLNEKNMEEKVGFLFHLLEPQQKTFKAAQETFFSESSRVGDITYKSLYIDSQKKVEALTEENLQLTKKLENALGQIEVHEKGYRLLFEVLEKLKEVVWASSMTKATEAKMNAPSAEPIHNTCTAAEAGPASVERKTLDRETKRN